MSHYTDKPEDLTQDTKEFLNSEYGKYLVPILEDLKQGYLSAASDMQHPYPERYLAKFSALKEVTDLILSPLDDSNPTHG